MEDIKLKDKMTAEETVAYNKQLIQDFKSRKHSISKIIRKGFFTLKYGFIHNSCSKLDEDVIDFSLSEKFDNDTKNKKIVIYTCITGNYDGLKDPLFVNDNVDYIVFTDSASFSSRVWKRKDIPEFLKKETAAYQNRYIKLHPNELFKDYDYAIYIDGSVLITGDVLPLLKLINPQYGFGLHKHSERDCIYEEYKACIWAKKGNKEAIKKQIKRYKKEGFPKHYGMLECTLLFTIIGKESETIYSAWWEELINSGSGRDQLSLPYVLWKLSIPTKEVATIGANLLMSSLFIVLPHK